MGPVGFEPTTNGLKGRPVPECLPTVNPSRDLRVTFAGADLARAILNLAAAGQPVPAILLDGLADAVLGSDPVRLAQQVKEGGEHQLDWAMELAGLVLRGQAADAAISPAPAVPLLPRRSP